MHQHSSPSSPARDHPIVVKPLPDKRQEFHIDQGQPTRETVMPQTDLDGDRTHQAGSLDLDDASASEALVADAFVRSGLRHQDQGDYTQAIQDFLNAITHYQATGCMSGEERALGSIGLAYYNAGDYIRAIEYSTRILNFLLVKYRGFIFY